jgi:hypothetical protein
MSEVSEQVYIAPLVAEALIWLGKKGVKWAIKKYIKDGYGQEAEDLCAQYVSRTICKTAIWLI